MANGTCVYYNFIVFNRNGAVPRLNGDSWRIGIGC
jgi:hypothetical protein